MNNSLSNKNLTEIKFEFFKLLFIISVKNGLSSDLKKIVSYFLYNLFSCVLLASTLTLAKGNKWFRICYIS